MKRFFRNLKSLAMVAMMGVAALSVSCAEEYDDTEIKQSIEDLYARVEALEIKLNSEVATLKSLIDSKIAAATEEVNGAIADLRADIAIVDCVAGADGTWVLTLANGEEAVIYPKPVQTGLTVVKEGDVYYWAMIGEDGKTSYLVDANGNKYAVHHATVVPEIEIPECHAEPQVRQDAEGRTEVSFDGGQTWHKLGASGDAGLFQSVVVNPDGTVDFTLNSGEVFTVTLPEEFAFEVVGNKAYFNAAEEKLVGVVAKGITDLTVIAKPEGWKAAMSGSKLSVVAPAQEAIEAGNAEESGVVKVLAISNENKAVIGKLNVSATAGYSVSVEMVDGVQSVVVTNDQILGQEGDYIYYSTLYVGMFPKGEYDAQGLVDAVNNYSFPYQFQYAQEHTTVYPLDEFYSACCDVYWEGLTIEPGAEYTLFVTAPVQVNMWQSAIYPEEIVFYDYKAVACSVTEVSSSFKDIQIEANIAGFAGYQVYFGEYDPTYGSWQDDFDYWQMGWGDFGFTRYEEKFTGSLFDFGYDAEGWSEKLRAMPGTEYELVIIPLVEGKDVSEYTYDDAKAFYFKTKPAVEGGLTVPTFTVNTINYENIKVDVNVENAYISYYKFYREADYEKVSADKEFLREDLMTNGAVKLDASYTVSQSGLNQGESRYLAAVAIDNNGQYGDVVVEKYTTEVFQFSETLKVKLEDFQVNDYGNEAYFKVSTEGGTAKQYRYANVNNTFSWTNTYGGSAETAAQYIATVASEWYGPIFLDAETGKNARTGEIDLISEGEYAGYFRLKGLVPGETYQFVILVIDADGNTSHGVHKEYTPEMSGTLIYSDEAAWAASEPTVVFDQENFSTTVTDWGSTYYNYQYTISLGEGATQLWYQVMDEDYEGTYSSPWSLMQYLVTNVGTSSYYSQTITEDTTVVVEESYLYETAYLYMTWTDGQGNFFQCKKVNVMSNLPIVEEEVPAE